MFSKILVFIDRGLSFFENWTLFLVVMAALITLFANVILRYVFNYALNWSEELVREVIQYLTFVGCGAAIKTNQQMMLLFSVFVMVYGWKAVEQMISTGQTTILIGIPYKYLYIMIPAMGILMFVRTIQALWETISGTKIFGKHL
jgi:C4-dicarboxylate transporter DctQ subunit